MTIHLREVSQIFDDSFTRGQTPISVTGHWRIFSYIVPFSSDLRISKDVENFDMKYLEKLFLVERVFDPPG